MFAGIAIYIAISFNSSLANLVQRSGISWVTSSIILRAIISLSFARGFQLFIKSIQPKFNSLLIFAIGILIGFLISFGAQPIYNTDYGNYGITEMIIDIPELKIQTNNQFDLNSKPAIIAFFTSTCSHCKDASKKLGFIHTIGNSPQIISIFPGSKEDTENFISENNGNSFIYHLINNDKFFIETAGGSFPSVFLVDKEGNTIQHWFGDELNYSALDLIKTHN